MNCRPGTVALIVKGRPKNIGRFVYVACRYPDVDYSSCGYGVLSSWTVESLGADLDAIEGPVRRGHIPDLALQVLPGIGKRAAKALRRAKADADFDAALEQLAELAKRYGLVPAAIPDEDSALVDSLDLDQFA